MADIRINALATTAASTASDDFVAVDGSANGTRKLNAYSPTFGGNLTVSGTGGLILSSASPTISSSATNASLNYTANGTGNHLFNNAINVNGVNGVGKLNVRAETDGNLHTRAYSLINGSGTGVALDALNDANNSLTGFYIRGNAIKLGGGPVTITDNLTVSGTQMQMGGVNPFIQGTTGAGYIQFQNAGDVVLASNTGKLVLIANGSTQATVATTGNFLIGTTTDGGQKLQVNGTALLGTDNASLGAYFDYNGGISGNATLWLKQTTKSSSTYTLTGGGTYTALNAPSGGSIYLRINNSDALTLDSSQNATFAGNITVDKATPAILVKRGANTQNGQLQFATGASGDFAIGNRGTSDSDLHIYNYGLSADSITISKNTSAVTFAGSIAIGNTVNTVSPTSPNRTITMVIGGTTYYIHAKTTND